MANELAKAFKLALRWTPRQCRILAREGMRMFTLRELARLSGIPYAIVFKMSKMESWDNVPVKRLVKYINACNKFNGLTEPMNSEALRIYMNKYKKRIFRKL